VTLRAQCSGHGSLRTQGALHWQTQGAKHTARKLIGRVAAAQGSTLSTLLCSLYLGALEAQHLQPLLPPGAPPPLWGLPLAAPAASIDADASASTARLTALAAAAGGAQPCRIGSEILPCPHTRGLSLECDRASRARGWCAAAPSRERASLVTPFRKSSHKREDARRPRASDAWQRLRLGPCALPRRARTLRHTGRRRLQRRWRRRRLLLRRRGTRERRAGWARGAADRDGRAGWRRGWGACGGPARGADAGAARHAAAPAAAPAERAAAAGGRCACDHAVARNRRGARAAPAAGRALAPARALHRLRRAWSGFVGGGSFWFLKARVGPLHPACKPVRIVMGCM